MAFHAPAANFVARRLNQPMMMCHRKGDSADSGCAPLTQGSSPDVSTSSRPPCSSSEDSDLCCMEDCWDSKESSPVPARLCQDALGARVPPERAGARPNTSSSPTRSTAPLKKRIRPGGSLSSSFLFEGPPREEKVELLLKMLRAQEKFLPAGAGTDGRGRRALCHDASPFVAKRRHWFVAWMNQMSSFLGYSRDTVAVALNYFDRYTCAKPCSPTLAQAAAATALHLAAKFEETNPAPLRQLLKFAPVFSSEQLLKMEMSMLKVLDWDLRPVTVYDFIRAFCAVLPAAATSAPSSGHAKAANGRQLSILESKEDRERELDHLRVSAEDIADISSDDVAFLDFLPSTLATSAILLSAVAASSSSASASSSSTHHPPATASFCGSSPPTTYSCFDLLDTCCSTSGVVGGGGTTASTPASSVHRGVLECVRLLGCSSALAERQPSVAVLARVAAGHVAHYAGLETELTAEEKGEEEEEAGNQLSPAVVAMEVEGGGPSAGERVVRGAARKGPVGGKGQQRQQQQQQKLSSNRAGSCSSSSVVGVHHHRPHAKGRRCVTPTGVDEIMHIEMMAAAVAATAAGAAASTAVSSSSSANGACNKNISGSCNSSAVLSPPQIREQEENLPTANGLLSRHGSSTTEASPAMMVDDGGDGKKEEEEEKERSLAKHHPRPRPTAFTALPPRAGVGAGVRGGAASLGGGGGAFAVNSASAAFCSSDDDESNKMARTTTRRRKRVKAPAAAAATTLSSSSISFSAVVAGASSAGTSPAEVPPRVGRRRVQQATRFVIGGGGVGGAAWKPFGTFDASASVSSLCSRAAAPTIVSFGGVAGTRGGRIGAGGLIGAGDKKSGSIRRRSGEGGVGASSAPSFSSSSLAYLLGSRKRSAEALGHCEKGSGFAPPAITSRAVVHQSGTTTTTASRVLCSSAGGDDDTAAAVAQPAV